MPLRDSIVKSRTRNLRFCMTDAEHALWRQLRDRRLVESKFRRQHAVDHYIVDFVCIERKLIIELDGGQHAEEAARRYDTMRTEHLEKCGFRVLRFWNNEVLRERQAVMEVIYQALMERWKNPLTQPSPPQTGARVKRRSVSS